MPLIYGYTFHNIKHVLKGQNEHTVFFPEVKLVNNLSN